MLSGEFDLTGTIDTFDGAEFRTDTLLHAILHSPITRHALDRGLSPTISVGGHSGGRHDGPRCYARSTSLSDGAVTHP